MNDIDKFMAEMIKSCDFHTDENEDGIHYDDCIECYRYETCKEYAEKQLKGCNA